MIDINLYRNRIGTFSQKGSCRKEKCMKMFGSQSESIFGRSCFHGAQFIFKLFLILVFLDNKWQYASWTRSS